MATDFDISPDQEAKFSQFLYRQFFVKPTPVLQSQVDLQEKTAIVTGSNRGIGLECCRQLLRLGLSKLIIAARNEERGRDAIKELLSGQKHKRTIEVWQIDMESYTSIASFAERANSLDRIDYVILNAGVLRATFRLNPTTGHEDNVQVNYLSTALLTIMLLPVLKSKRQVQGQSTRLILVTSDAAPWADFPEQDSQPLIPSFDKPRNINMTLRYYTSRLLQQFFLAEIAQHVPASVAVISATTPGLVHSTASLQELPGIGGHIQRGFTRLIGYSPEVGARQLVDAAVSHGDETHGQYLCSQRIKPMAPIIYTTKGQEIQQTLWKDTMREFQFVSAENIIREVSGQV